MKKLLLTLTALSMALGVSACADMHNDAYRDNGARRDHMHMKAENHFNAMDRNNDGYISRAEFNTFKGQWFRAADTNHDGRLTLNEMEAKMANDKQANYAKDRY